MDDLLFEALEAWRGATPEARESAMSLLKSFESASGLKGRTSAHPHEQIEKAPDIQTPADLTEDPASSRVR